MNVEIGEARDQRKEEEEEEREIRGSRKEREFENQMQGDQI